MKGGNSHGSSNRRILEFLLGIQQECEGVIPFERYMREALYHPLHGYYSRHIETVGRSGDFSTSTTLDSNLGAALAAWITKRAQEFGWERIPIIEIGAGSGQLARLILRHLSWKLRGRVDYMIHEKSPVLEKEQRSRLRWRGVRWVRSLPETLTRTSGRALIFSNELVDAFPCKLFQRAGESWQELGVSISEEFGLTEKAFSRIPCDPWFSQFGNIPEGQLVEMTSSYREWISSWYSNWHEGAILTIDYGDTAEKLYDRRPNGSLRAYWRHQRLTGANLFARFGKQDLTADVNFSDLIRWGDQLGWKTSLFQTQRDFIKSWIPENNLHGVLPDEVGEAFKVLEQQPFKPVVSQRISDRCLWEQEGSIQPDSRR